MVLVSIRLPRELLQEIDRAAKREKRNRSVFIRRCIENALHQETQPPTGQIEQLREELLLAVGQVGATVKALPKFLKETGIGEVPRISNRENTKVEKEETRLSERQSTVASNANKPSDPEHRQDTSAKPTKQNGPTDEPDDRLKLRPRFDVLHDPSKEIVLDVEIVKPSASEMKTVAGENSNAQPTDQSPRIKDRRSVRSDNRLDGLAIGNERRQSIRLARAMAFKGWNASQLAQRLKMRLNSIEDALNGEADLASLKVEALLATWEDEMLDSGWEPTIQSVAD